MKALLVLLLWWPLLASTSTVENIELFTSATACQQFDSTVVGSGHLWLLLFKKPYCPWCADFDFEWQTAVYDLRTAPRIRFGEVNIRACPEIAQRYGATSAPSTVLVAGTKWKLYGGARSAQGVVSAAGAALNRWKVDVAGVLDPKVPLLVLTASTLDTHLLAVPSPPLSIAGRERSIPPFVLQVSSRWPPSGALIDTRLQALGVRAAYASPEPRLLARLDALIEQGLVQDGKLIAPPPSNNNKRRPPRALSSKASALDRFYGFPGLNFLSETINDSATCANNTPSPHQLTSGEHLNDESSQGEISVATSIATGNAHASTSGGDEDEDDATCSWWEVVAHELNFRGKPSANGPLMGSHTRGYAFRGACVVEPGEKENTQRNIASDARNIGANRGSNTNTASTKATPGSISSSFGALGDVGKCNWLRTCSASGKSIEGPRYVTRVGTEIAQSTTPGGLSLRVQLASNATRPVFALETTSSASRGGGSGTTTATKRIVDVLLDWATSEAAGGSGGLERALPAAL